MRASRPSFQSYDFYHVQGGTEVASDKVIKPVHSNANEKHGGSKERPFEVSKYKIRYWLVVVFMVEKLSIRAS